MQLAQGAALVEGFPPVQPRHPGARLKHAVALDVSLQNKARVRPVHADVVVSCNGLEKKSIFIC